MDPDRAEELTRRIRATTERLLAWLQDTRHGYGYTTTDNFDYLLFRYIRVLYVVNPHYTDDEARRT